MKELNDRVKPQEHVCVNRLYVSDMEIVRDEYSKALFKTLFASKNQRLIKSLAHFITNCFEVRSVILKWSLSWPVWFYYS